MHLKCMEKSAKIDNTDTEVYFHFKSRVLVRASSTSASSHHFTWTMTNLSLRHPIYALPDTQGSVPNLL